MVARRIPNKFSFHPVKDIQVLAPMNRGGLGARALNERLKAALNPSPGPTITRYGTSFSEGDKVIQQVNNYDKEVFNGDIGVIAHVDTEEGEVLIRYDEREVHYESHQLDEVGLAYAVTIHKSQGSEYPVVVLPIAMQHYTLLQRNLLYTGVTRGKQLVIVIGQPKAVAMAVKNKQAERRLTKLAKRLGG